MRRHHLRIVQNVNKGPREGRKEHPPYNRSISTTTTTDESIDIHLEAPTVSHSKIINIEHRTETKNDDELTGNRK